MGFYKNNHIFLQRVLKLSLQLLIIFGSFTSYAQTTGYLGKKFLIKTNAINGFRFGLNAVDIEYVVDRKTSLNIGFQVFNYVRGEKGATARTGKLEPGNRNRKYSERSTLKNGKTSGWIASIGFKRYFNEIMPAPWGFYIEYNIGFGSATYKDYEVSYSYRRGLTTFSDEDIIPRKNVTGINGESSLLFFEIPGFGYQKIIKRWICIDGKISLQGQYCMLPENMLSALEHNYYVRTNVAGFGYNKFSAGLAIYLKIGLLLF